MSVIVNSSIEGSPDHCNISSQPDVISIDLFEEKVSSTGFYIDAGTLFIVDLANIKKIGVDFDSTILSQEQADLRPRPIVIQQSS